MRRLWLTLATIFAVTGAHAQSLGFPGIVVPGAPVIGLPGVWVPTNINFVPTSFIGTPAAFFGDTNPLHGSALTQQNYLCATTSTACTNATATAAFLLPTFVANGCAISGKVCSWTLFMKFQYTPNLAAVGTVNNTDYLALGGNCLAACSANAGDRGLWINNVSTTSPASNSLNQQIEFYWLRASGNTNVWQPPTVSNPYTGINPVPGKNYCLVLSQYGYDSAQIAGSLGEGLMSLSVDDNTGTPAPGAPVVTSTPNYTAGSGNSLYYSSGTITTQATMGPILPIIGITSTTAANARGTPGPMSDVGMIYGVFPNASGTPNATLIADFCNGSKTFAQWWTEYQTAASGFGTQSLNAWYPLNANGTVTAAGTSPTPTVTTALENPSGGTIIAASALTPSAALTITDFGAVDVMGIQAGAGATAATGTVYIQGTYNITALGGTPTGFQAELLQNGTPTVTWTSFASPNAGTYRGGISGVPANYLATAGGNTANATPYTVCVRPTNAPTYVQCSYSKIYVGLVNVDIGQSEKALMYSPSSPSSSNSVQIPSGDVIVVAGDYALQSDPTTTSLGSYNTNCRAANGYPGCPVGPIFPSKQAITGTSSTPENTPGIGVVPLGTCTGVCVNQLAGDGALQGAVTLAAISNLPIKIIDITHTGYPVGGWIASYLSNTVTLSGVGTSGSPLTSSITMSALQDPSNPTIPGSSTWSGLFYSILPGSVQVFDSNNCVIANDVGSNGLPYGSGTFNTGSSGCAGEGSVQAGSAIVYGPSYAATTGSSVSGTTLTIGTVTAGVVQVGQTVSGTSITGSPTILSGSGTTWTLSVSQGTIGAEAIAMASLSTVPPGINNLFFSSTPICTCTMTYTLVTDSFLGAYARQTAQANSVFTGEDWFGNGTTGTGEVTNIVNQVFSGPPTLWRLEQISANIGNFNTLIVPTNNTAGYSLYFQNEWRYVFGTKFGTFWWYSNQIPILAQNYTRDTISGVAEWGGATQWFLNFVNAGLTNPNVYYGGTMDDLTLQIASVTGSGPHQDGSAFGALREGRRDGLNSWNGFLRQSAPEPTIATVVVDTTSSGCSGAGACVDITFATNASTTKLETCGNGGLIGSGQGINSNPANGVCTFTDFSTTPLCHGFSFASSGTFPTSGTIFYDDFGNDENNNTTPLDNSGTATAYFGGTCTLIAAKTVLYKFNTPGAWTVGQRYMKYNDPWYRAGSLISVAVTAGSYTCVSSCTPIVTATLGSSACSPLPKVTESLSGGTTGGLVVTVNQRGGGCTSAPVIAISGNFVQVSAGSITATVASSATDISDMSSKLYSDDSDANYTIGATTSLAVFGASATTSANGGSEPGYPVTLSNYPNVWNGGAPF